MSIVNSIEDFLGIEALRSGELFSRFVFLSKAEKWYYVNSHPAPPGVTAVQGPRKAWRWNASMARQAGVSEADIASHTKDKSAQSLAEARPFADVVRAERTPVDSEPEDIFEDWKTFTATHRRVTSKEVSGIRAQQKAAGLGDGTVAGTIFPEAIAQVNDKGEITQATTMDGQLIPVFDSETKDGRILRVEGQFNTSVDSENQFQYKAGDINHFRKTGKNRLKTINLKSRFYLDTKNGKKEARLNALSEVYSDLMTRIGNDLTNPKAIGKMRSNSVRESAFALALIDHTYKRIGSDGGKSTVTFDGKEGRRFKIDSVATKEYISDAKKKGIKVTKDSKGRIFTVATRGANKGKKVDRTKYARGVISTYGITDCLPQHIKQDGGGNVSLVFPGKDGVVNNSPIKDPFLAKELIKRKKNAKDKNTPVVGTSASTVREYLKAASGRDINPHKFRAYHATRLAGNVIKSIGDAPKISAQAFNAALRKENDSQIRRSGKGYSSEELKNVATTVVKQMQLQSIVDSVGDKVAPKLGHSPSVCVDEYINKNIFEETGWQKQFNAEVELHTSKNLTSAVRKKKSKARKKRR